MTNRQSVIIDSQFIRSDAFQDALSKQCGAWIKLMLYCKESGNEGVIHHCREWTPAVWLSEVGVKKITALKPSALWYWQDSALHVLGYVTTETRKRERL